MLAPWKKSYDYPKQSIKKQRHHFADKGLYSQRCGFSSGHVHRCESQTIRKAERQIIDAFELWCWKRLLRVPWTARIWNQSILKEINPEYSLEGLMQKLELQYFGRLMQSQVIGKDPDAAKDWRQEEKGETEDEVIGCHHWLNGHEFEQTQGDSEGQGRLVCCSSWGHRIEHDLVSEQQL